MSRYTCDKCGAEYDHRKYFKEHQRECDGTKTEEVKEVVEEPIEEPAVQEKTGLTLELHSEDHPEVVMEKPEPSLLSKEGILKAIRKALKMDAITSTQAAQIRAEHGIFKGHFTKKRVPARIRRQKRKAQRLARRITRRHGYKGQKSSSKYKKA